MVAPAAIAASVQSWLGHARHADTYRLRRRLLSTGVVQLVAEV